MSQKKNECELILIDPSNDIEIKPMKILKKMVSNAGGVRYLVEYNNNEQKQETEKFMKENYQELIEDYNYFSVCGSRFDQLTLQKMRENNNKIQNFENHAKLPTIPSDENYPIFKRQKKIDKLIEKNNNNKTNILPLPQQQQLLQLQQQQQQQSNQQQQLLQQQQQNQQQQSQILQTNNLNQNEKYLIKQQQVQNQNLLQFQSDQGDKIKSISLENGLFLVQWLPRPDGNIPYQEYYHYDFLKATAPTILLSFLEQEFLKNDLKFKNLKRHSFQNKEIIQNDYNLQNIETQIITQSLKSQENNETQQKIVLKEDISNKKDGLFEEVKEQKDHTKDILIDEISVDEAQEVILDEKQTIDKEKKQQQQKKGIIPTSKPSGQNQKQRKSTLDKGQDILTIDKTKGKLDEKLSQIEKSIPKQQVTITQPILTNQSIPVQFAIAQTSDEFDIFGSLDKPDDKQNENYEKALEECYSDVDLPQFQFNQSEL